MPPKAKATECAKVYVLTRDNQQIHIDSKVKDDIFGAVFYVPLTDFVSNKNFKDVIFSNIQKKLFCNIL